MWCCAFYLRIFHQRTSSPPVKNKQRCLNSSGFLSPAKIKISAAAAHRSRPLSRNSRLMTPDQKGIHSAGAKNQDSYFSTSAAAFNEMSPGHLFIPRAASEYINYPGFGDTPQREAIKWPPARTRL